MVQFARGTANPVRRGWNDGQDCPSYSAWVLGCADLLYLPLTLVPHLPRLPRQRNSRCLAPQILERVVASGFGIE